MNIDALLAPTPPAPPFLDDTKCLTPVGLVFFEERKLISEIAVQHVNGASLVVSGVSAEGTREATQMARARC